MVLMARWRRHGSCSVNGGGCGRSNGGILDVMVYLQYTGNDNDYCYISTACGVVW